MGESVRAWRPPGVPAVREVLHATFEQHAYPAHTHEDWTVLLIDDGAVSYRLDRAAYQAVPATTTLLPPGVPHDGRTAVPGRSFRKRVLYVERGWLPETAARAAARRPFVADPDAHAALADVHVALTSPPDALAAEGGLHVLRDLVLAHLGTPPGTTPDVPLARRLRELLDDRLTEPVTLVEAARQLGAHPNHLVRAFSGAYGIPPHRYVVGRRVDFARHLLLRGRTPAQAAAEAGFHDQAHLTRHFRRTLGVTPAAFAA